MEKFYLAVDIGASGGRHILGYVSGGKLKLEEIYRFENKMHIKNGSYCWDVQRLFKEILNGLKECAKVKKIPTYMGIDTWGVDFVLLNSNDEIIGDAIAYRDDRTNQMDNLVYEKICPTELYERTGIQKQIFNTIYQLMAIKTKQPHQLEKAQCMLMIPEYFNFLLTGVKKAEYTNATTTQLLNVKTKDWDTDIIDRLGYKKDLFQELHMPGESVGSFTDEIQKLVGFNCEVILPATHDTGSAVMAVPSTSDNVLYLSSGTWSLMGVELSEANCSMDSMNSNFTNEGGYDYRFRYLKNIMGLWMIQSLKKELHDEYSFEQLCAMAESENIESLVDCQDERFLAPDSMIEAIKTYCAESNQAIPATQSQLSAVIYNSLAHCYASTIKELEKMNNTVYPCIYIVGGGANAQYLNKITAEKTQKIVYTGPTEATAIGNILAQMLSDGTFNTLTEARTCVHNSFEIKKYE